MRDERSRPQLGEIFAGKYLLTRLVGAGKASVVFAARHHVTGKRFAIRCYVPGRAGSEARVALEHQRIAQFRHPHVLDTYDIGEAGGAPYAVLEWAEGESLDMRCKRVGWIAVPDACRLLVPCMRGLHAARSARVVRCEVKPESIFVFQATHTTPEIAKVLDFDVEEPVTDRAAPRRRRTEFRAPELDAGKPIDPRADVYAFGAILRYIVSARPSPSPIATPPPEAAMEIIARATATDRAERHATLIELADALESFAEVARPAAPRKSHFASDALARAALAAQSPLTTQFAHEVPAAAAPAPTKRSAKTMYLLVAVALIAIGYVTLSDTEDATHFDPAATPLDPEPLAPEIPALPPEPEPEPEPVPLPTTPPPPPLDLPLADPLPPSVPPPPPRPVVRRRKQTADVAPALAPAPARTPAPLPPSHTRENGMREVPEMNLL